MRVIRATGSQIPGMVEIWEELMELHARMEPHYVMREDAPSIWEAFVRESLTRDDVLVLAVLEEEVVVGYSISRLAEHPPVYENPRYGLIQDMAVRSTSRRLGAGGLMVGRIKEWLASQGVGRIELRAASRNQMACSFWESEGFRDYEHVMFLDL